MKNYLVIIAGAAIVTGVVSGLSRESQPASHVAATQVTVPSKPEPVSAPMPIETVLPEVTIVGRVPRAVHTQPKKVDFPAFYPRKSFDGWLYRGVGGHDVSQ